MGGGALRLSPAPRKSEKGKPPPTGKFLKAT